MNIGAKSALVLIHEPDGPAGEVGVRLSERGFELTEHVILPEAGPQPFPCFDGYDLLVVMGSECSLTSERPAWLEQEIKLLGDTQIPVLGICFGGQILAEANGGRVETSPVTEIGWCQITNPGGSTNPIGSGPWLEWHHDRFEAPPQAELLAVNDTSQQMFRLGRSLGTQFHPEVNLAHVKLWLDNSEPDYIERHSIDVDALLAETEQREPANIAQCHQFVDWYLDSVFSAPHR